VCDPTRCPVRFVATWAGCGHGTVRGLDFARHDRRCALRGDRVRLRPSPTSSAPHGFALRHSRAPHDTHCVGGADASPAPHWMQYIAPTYARTQRPPKPTENRPSELPGSARRTRVTAANDRVQLSAAIEDVRQVTGPTWTTPSAVWLPPANATVVVMS